LELFLELFLDSENSLLFVENGGVAELMALYSSPKFASANGQLIVERTLPILFKLTNWFPTMDREFRIAPQPLLKTQLCTVPYIQSLVNAILLFPNQFHTILRYLFLLSL
jgi:hypothetical protein